MSQVVGVGDFVFGDDGGAEGAEAVEAFAAGELAAAEGFVALPVAGGNIVGTGVAEHVLEGVFAAHVLGGFADHDGQLGFVVDLAAAPRERNGIKRIGERVARFDEEHRIDRNARPALFGVLSIIEPDTEDVGGDQRSQQFVDADDLVGEPMRGKQIACDQSRGVGINGLAEMDFAGGEEADDAHAVKSISDTVPGQKKNRAGLLNTHSLGRPGWVVEMFIRDGTCCGETMEAGSALSGRSGTGSSRDLRGNSRGHTRDRNRGRNCGRS